MEDPEGISLKVKSLTEDAVKYMMSGDSRHAFECYRDAFKLSLNVGTPQQVLSCACNYGASCLVNDKADEAIELLEEYLQKADDTLGEDDNFFALIADVHYNLALAYNVKCQFELAISHLNDAINIFHERNVSAPLAESYQQLGDVCLKAGKKNAAMEAYVNAARTFSKENNMSAEGKSYMKLAKMHLEAKETEKCLQQLRKCEKICLLLIQNSPKFGTSAKRLIYDLAMTFKKAKDPDKTVRWLERAEAVDLEKKPTNEAVHVHAVIVQNLGKMYIETRNYNNAVEKYQKAAAYYGQLGNMKARGWCFYHLGGIYLTLKDSRSSERNFHVANQMLEDAGNISHLWKIKEGLGDLHTVTYRYTAAVTYYKETLTLIGLHSSRNVLKDQRRIVEKLTAVLDSQKNGGKRDIHISYNNRRPVVLPMSNESSLEYSTIGRPPVPSSNGGPITSTPVSEGGRKTKHRKGKKGTKGKKGRKRSDLLTAPVPNGVSEYDSCSDMSLMEREMRRQLSLSCSLGSKRSHSLPKDLGHTYEELGRDDSGMPSSSRRTASQEDLKNGKRNGWRIFRRKDSGSSSDSSTSGLETASTDSHLQSTSGTQTVPLYATIDRKNTGEMKANFFTNDLASTNADVSSTIPSRWAPDPPEQPPTLPPNHPSFVKRNKHQSGSSDGVQQYPETPVMNNLSRSQREAELYEVAREEQEFWNNQEGSPHRRHRSEMERRRMSVRNSRMCLVM